MTFDHHKSFFFLLIGLSSIGISINNLNTVNCVSAGDNTA